MAQALIPAIFLMLTPLAIGCAAQCEGAGCGSLYPRADLHIFYGGGLGTGEVDPQAADATIAGGDSDGYDWTLGRVDGGVLAGVPSAEELRWYTPAAVRSGGAATTTLSGLGAGDRFGAAVAVVSDTNLGSTLLVGAPENSPGPLTASAGAVYVYTGVGADLAGADVPDRTVTGLAAEDKLGSGVWGCGDLDADGAADWVVSAPWASDGGTLSGTVYVAASSMLPDDAELTADDLVRLPGPGVAARFGAAVVCSASLDGDPYADLVVGAPYATVDGLASAGAVLIWRGTSTLADDAPYVLSLPGQEKGDYLGAALAVGDLDGDGYDELIVGAPGHDSTLPNGDDAAGAVYIYDGEALDIYLSRTDFTIDALQPSHILRGALTMGRFGASLAVGDLDGEGADDLVVGAPGTNPVGQGSAARAGEATVWTGGMDNWPAVQFAGDAPIRIVAPRQYLETGAVLSISDIDADGRGDLLLLNRAKLLAD
jgi:hypothetical protein